MYMIAEHFASLIDGVIMVAFLGCLLGFREDRKKYAVVFVVLHYLCAQYFVELPILQTALAILMNVLYCKVCLRGKVFLWCVWSIGEIIIYIIANGITLPILSLVMQQPLSVFIAGDLYTRIFTILISKLAQCTLLWLILMQRQAQLFLKPLEYFLVFLILIADTFILLGLLVINQDMGLYGKDQVRLLSIFALLLLVLFCCIFLVIHISKMNEREADAQIIQLQLDNQKALIEKAYEMQKEARIIRHDLRHYVGAWLNEIENSRLEEAQKEMNMFLGKVSMAGTTVCYIENNEILNSVLFDKIGQCREKNITYRCEGTTSFPKEREMDMAIILSNLMDNAIRAEETIVQEKRDIFIQLFEIHERRHMVISNYIEESVLKENPSLKTTKADKSNHGFGIMSVRKIVKKYDAVINILEEDKHFLVHITGI